MSVGLSHEPRAGVWRPLFGYLGGVLAWALQLAVGYPLVQLSCVTGTTLWIHIVSLVAIIITIAAGLVSYSVWRTGRAHDTADGQGEQAWGRDSFLGASGMLMSGLFLLLILYSGIPAFFLNPCHIR